MQKYCAQLSWDRFNIVSLFRDTFVSHLNAFQLYPAFQIDLPTQSDAQNIKHLFITTFLRLSSSVIIM